MIISPERLKALRAGFRLTQAEAAAIVGVSTRTWTSWETGQRNMPDNAFELFRLRTTHSSKELVSQGIITHSDADRQLVVFVGPDHITPVDVVAKHNFLDAIESAEPGKVIVTSLAIDPHNFPYVHRSQVDANANRGGLEKLAQWKTERDNAQ
jgi:hypothetical protein